jgi:uncharacterized alpha-E superfamily protein
MLSRIGNSLFWMGRYIERTEHLARYTKVQYVSSLDAPLAQSKEFVLESILSMAGTAGEYFARYPQLTDEDVLNFMTLDESNPFSILTGISYIRENARGARDSISLEMWEATNRFYHSMRKFTPERLNNEGVYDFSQKVEENSSVLKGYIDNTLIRNEVWMLISLGIHLERAMQVARILLTKVKDIDKIEPSKLGGPVENYQWTTLLKSAESYDMNKRYYKSPPNRRNSLEFLMFNPLFPKSILYNLLRVYENICSISFNEPKGKNSFEFMVGKITTHFQYLSIEEVEHNIIDFLNDTLNKVNHIAIRLEERYLLF